MLYMKISIQPLRLPTCATKRIMTVSETKKPKITEDQSFKKALRSFFNIMQYKADETNSKITRGPDANFVENDNPSSMPARNLLEPRREYPRIKRDVDKCSVYVGKYEGSPT